MPTTYKLAYETENYCDDEDMVNLAKASVLDMRTAWQASRESLVVDVDWPEANDDFWKDGDEGAYASGHIDGRQQTTDAVVKAIRTAGIRIKGESE
ncbi:hypothetical protein BED35_07080 [Yersinia enterocolitica]|uniref:hypothetical protein n=1 Tax=Yersinia enterocolitica TaxID=630 RepID=UPI000856E73F|nr:hypothetical protein [Yersinia enterocolitica]AOF20983.1 hypothetical protein BED34_06630 [Yersinia enterocolitica]AOF25167.1 hypothetical protein BED33_09290 [Yersinia enterocolitica]AOF29162.1 hypothetical protein BED32_06605 [Yersinia enterocolitica]AOF33331.1 hypothetical protein BED35_07080 [Yersinia enterocolitica]AOF37255.1 hypothetical protein BFS78_06150 [Yersinia enterocolitica]